MTGNYKQETTTGKQLFNKDGDLNYPDNTSYANATTLLSNGTLKSKSNSNSNASKGARLTGLKANTIYTVKGKIKSMTHNVRIRIMGYSTNWKAIVEPIFTSIGDFKFTFNTSSEYSDFFLSLNGYYNDSTTITEAIFDEVMVYEGTDDIPYEKYTEEISSPNPKYKQDIEVINGCNRFDKNTANIGKALDSSANLVTNSKITTSDYIEVKSNANYIIQNVIGGNIGRSSAIYDKDKILIEIKTLSNKDSGNLEVTTPYNAKYIRIACRAEDIDILQLTEGIEEKPYLPHGSIGLKFSGKNFLKLQDGTYTNNGITCVVSDGVITANGTASINTVCNIPINEITLNGTYISSSFNTIANANVQSRLDEDSETYYNLENVNATHTFTKNENIKYTKYVFRVTGGTTLNNFIVKPMLSVDVGDYEPYHEPQLIPINLSGNSIAKVNDSIKDELSIYRNGKILLTKKTWEDTIKSKDLITLANNNKALVYTTSKKKTESIANDDFLVSNAQRNKTFSDGTVYQNLVNFVFVGDKNDTLETMQGKFNNGQILYQLATPQTIELPSVDMPELWEGTVNVELISNLETNLNVNYNIVPAMPSVEARSDIESTGDNGKIDIKQTDENSLKEIRHQMILNKPLRGIKTTDSSKANYIDENGNYWITDYVADDGIHRKIGEISFDGTENNWSDQWRQCDTDARKFFSLQITSIKNDTKNRQAICNLFKYTNLNIQSKTVDITAFHFNNGANFSDFIYFKIEKFLLPTPDIAGWKKLLVQLKENGTPLTVQYELGEEKLEEFTEEERKSWNEFKKMKTFKSKNYISSVDDIQAGLEFSYKKDSRISTKKELEKCNERLSNIEQLLSTTETSSLLLDNLENDLKKEVE